MPGLELYGQAQDYPPLGKEYFGGKTRVPGNLGRHSPTDPGQVYGEPQYNRL